MHILFFFLNYICMLVCVYFETSFHYITLVGVGLKLRILLLLPSKY